MPEERPVRALPALAAVLGFLVGGITAAGTVLARHAVGPRIHSTAVTGSVTGLPVFGGLPAVRRRRNRTVAGSAQTASLVAETLRALWLAMRAPHGGTAIVVTSSEVGEGKTTVAVALARCIAEDGFRVLLIDGDLRRPRIASMLGLEPEIPLEAVLSGSVIPEVATLYEAQAGVHCLLADGSLANPIKALTSEAFRRLMEESKRAYDFVILDSPPVLHVADPVVLANACEHILFVVQSGRVPAEQVNEAIRRFSEGDRPKIVTLLNRVRPSSLDKRDYYSGYAV